MKASALRAVLTPKRFFTPAGLTIRAVELAIPFVVAHLLGLRRFTSVLCGTMETGEPARMLCALAGLVYVLLYLGATVISPTLAIGAGLLWGVERVHLSRHRKSQ
jgi:hypothetical protein